MQLRVISSIEQLKALRERWNALLADSDCDVIHLRHEWFLSSMECFHTNDCMYVIHLSDDHGHSFAIAPLVICRRSYRGINLKIICFPDNGQTPYHRMIIKKGCFAEGVTAIWSHLNSFKCWDLVQLQKIREGGTFALSVETALLHDRCFFGKKSNIASPYISISGTWGAFFAQKSTNLKKSMRNKINKINREQNISVIRVDLENSLVAEMEEIVRVSGKSWKRNIGTDLSSHSKNQQFYRKICDRFGPQGYVSVWLLKKNKTTIAFEFHLIYNNIVYPIRADYDESFKKLSPGSVLEFNILQSLFTEAEVKEYNSCGHTYPYLLNWSDNIRQYVNLEIFSKSPKMILLYILEYMVLPVFRTFKLNRTFNLVKRQGLKWKNIGY